MAVSAVTKNSKNMKQTISHELPNGLCQNICHTDDFIEFLYEGTKQVRHSFPRNSCKKIIARYKMIAYNIDVLRQTACLVVNLIKVNNFAYLFDCTMIGRASD